METNRRHSIWCCKTKCGKQWTYHHFRTTGITRVNQLLIQSLWFFVGLPLLQSSLVPSSSLKVFILRLFGASIGEGARIKPGVRVKYPWRFKTGKHCWIGEDAWIDSLDNITLGNNVCISQGAYLCTGNHNWSDPSFGLITKPISVGDGAWIGARASVGPGVTIGESSIVGFGAVVTGHVPGGEIHTDNPASFLRHREIGMQAQGNFAKEQQPCL